MSDWNRTFREYAERYARDKCNGDLDEAVKHKIVREFMCDKCTNEICKEHCTSILKRQKIRDCIEKAMEGRVHESN